MKVVHLAQLASICGSGGGGRATKGHDGLGALFREARRDPRTLTLTLTHTALANPNPNPIPNPNPDPNSDPNPNSYSPN